MNHKFKQIIVIIAIIAQFFWFLPYPTNASLTDEQAELQRQLDEIQTQINQLQKQLTTTTAQKKTLANKIYQLKINQEQIKAQIKQTTLRISKLSKDITVAQTELEKAAAREELVRAGLAKSMRDLNQQQDNIIMILAKADGLSDIFTQVRESVLFSVQISSLLKQLEQTQVEITEKKEELSTQKEDAANLLQIKSAQNTTLAESIGEQNNLLVKTKGQEATYASSLSDSKKRAAEIRSRIYELFNVGKQINFGQALEIATWAAGQTGQRAAFLLAVLTQESNLGKNVGTCNRPGDPPEKGWKVIMKPSRDQEPFLKITKELGLDPDVTPVSCPMRNKDGSQLGWGGAMGPAQFIPSTWMGYKDKVSAITGKTPADPWDIRDAFLAAAILLKAGGANGTDEGDWKAAMRYFSGGLNPAYSFYGDNVIKKTHQYEEDIAQLKQQ